MIRGTPLIAQRRIGDCAIAALAMFAMQTYEDTYVAFAKIDTKSRARLGAFNREVIAAAKLLGIALVPVRKFDLDDDEGVLRVKWNGKAGKTDPGGHFVAVRDGQVFCPSDAMVYPWREYMTLHNGRLGTLLKGDA